MPQQQFDCPTTTVRALYEALEARIPRSLSCNWDNDGLSCCPDPDAPVRGVLVALDPTEDAVAVAVQKGCNVLLTHHPMLFRGIKAVDGENTMSRKVISMIQAGISAMAFHTRLDALDGGVNDALAARLGLTDVTPFGDNGNPAGQPIGRIGVLPVSMAPDAFAALVAERLTVPATAEAYAVAASETARAISRNAARGADLTAQAVVENAVPGGDLTVSEAVTGKTTVTATVARPCGTGDRPWRENGKTVYIAPNGAQKPPVVYAGCGRCVSRVAVLGGSGEEELTAAMAAGADTFVTGECHYHTLCDAPYGAVNLIRAGHYFTEFPVCARLAEMAGEACPGVPVYVLGGTAVRCL